MAPKKFIVLSHLVSALIYFCCRHFDGVETAPSEKTSETFQSYFDLLENCTLPYQEWRHPTDDKVDTPVLEPCMLMTDKRSGDNETEKFRYDLCEVVFNTLVDVCENSGDVDTKGFDKLEFEDTMTKVTATDVCSLIANLDEYDNVLQASSTLDDDQLCKQHCGTDGSSGEMRSLCDVMATTICQSMGQFACGKLLDSELENKKTQEESKPQPSDTPGLPVYVFNNKNCTFPFDEWHHLAGGNVHASMIEPCLVMNRSRADYNELDKFRYDLCNLFMNTLVNVCSNSTEDIRKRFNETEFKKTMSIVLTKDMCLLMSRLGANFSQALTSAMKNDTLCEQTCNIRGPKLTCAVVATTVCQRMDKSVCLEILKDIPEGKNTNPDGETNDDEKDKKKEENTNPDDKKKDDEKDKQKEENTNPDDKKKDDKKDKKKEENTNPDDKKEDDEKDKQKEENTNSDEETNDDETDEEKKDETEAKSTGTEDSSLQSSNLVLYLIIFLAFSAVVVLLYHQRDKVKACFSKGQQGARDIMKKTKEAKYRKLKKEDGLMPTVEETDEMKKYVY